MIKRVSCRCRDTVTVDRLNLSHRQKLHGQAMLKVNSISLPSYTFLDCLELAGGYGLKGEAGRYVGGGRCLPRGTSVHWLYMYVLP